VRRYYDDNEVVFVGSLLIFETLSGPAVCLFSTYTHAPRLHFTHTRAHYYAYTDPHNPFYGRLGGWWLRLGSLGLFGFCSGLFFFSSFKPVNCLSVCFLLLRGKEEEGKHLFCCCTFIISYPPF